MKEEKWYENFTWLGYLNFIILQWFFIRLAKYREIYQMEITDVSMPNIGKNKDQGLVNVEGIYNKWKWRYKIIGPILPLTGWWNNYIYIRCLFNKHIFYIL